MPGRLYYLEPEVEHMRQAYKKLTREVAELFGADPTVASNDVEAMMALETEIANVSLQWFSCSTSI